MAEKYATTGEAMTKGRRVEIGVWEEEDAGEDDEEAHGTVTRVKQRPRHEEGDYVERVARYNDAERE